MHCGAIVLHWLYLSILMIAVVVNDCLNFTQMFLFSMLIHCLL